MSTILNVGAASTPAPRAKPRPADEPSTDIFAGLLAASLVPQRTPSPAPANAEQPGIDAESASDGSVAGTANGERADAAAGDAAGTSAAMSPAWLEYAAASAGEGSTTAADGASGAEGDGTGRSGGVPAGAANGAVAGVRRDAGDLDPELRARLERVADRMKAEHGYRVDVVEAYRSQARQNALFEQGRTTPGPVVTWTHASQHTLGRAADVMIDGSYDNPQGYAHLLEIAQQEGLRTLGARDPGHLELPRGAGGVRVPAFAPSTTLAVETGAGSMAGASSVGADGVARVATVATVAQVASVAEVAQVARVAADGRARVQPVAAEDERGASAELDAEARSGAEGRGSPAGGDPFAGSPLPGTAHHGGARAEALSGATGLDSVARIAQIAELRESAASRPLSQMTLHLDDLRGGQDQIRVDLRGLTVGAAIDVGDRLQAERLTANVGELRRALERHGLETDAVRVGASLTNTIDLARLTGSLPDAGGRSASDRPDHAPTPHRERDQQRRDGARPDTGDGSDEPHHRSRREHNGERNA